MGKNTQDETEKRREMGGEELLRNMYVASYPMFFWYDVKPRGLNRSGMHRTIQMDVSSKNKNQNKRK